MKSKLHFGILIVLITFLVRFLETPVAPNQQIVIQFSESEITDNLTAKTVDAIRTKLHVIGVEQIQVGQDADGHLKITYFSNTAVEEIQNILSDNANFKLTYGFEKEHSGKGSPDEKSDTYKVNVTEIHENSNSNSWDFDGIQVVEHNQKSDRFNNPKKHFSGHQIQSEFITEGVKITLNAIHKKLIKEHCAYSFPEVRAGPLA